MAGKRWQYDIFVSYAWADNQPLKVPHATEWVSTLVDNLRIKLQSLGHRDLSIFQDLTELPGNAQLRPDIEDAVKASATFMVVLSPGYCESTWCRDELAAFLARGGEAARSIFVVERVPVATRPTGLDNSPNYPFHRLDRARHPHVLGESGTPEPEYVTRLNNLSAELSAYLVRLRGAAPVALRDPGYSWIKQPREDNAIEIRRHTKSKTAVSSGYVIGPGRAITTTRKLSNRKSVRLECRTPRGNWVSAAIGDSGRDIAVLLTDVQKQADQAPWARWRRTKAIRCRFIGFIDRSGRTDTCTIQGQLVPGSFARSGDIELRPDNQEGPGTELLAGAAVFAKGHLIGVISQAGPTYVIRPLDELIAKLPDPAQVPYLEDIRVVRVPAGATRAQLEELLRDHLPGATVMLADEPEE